MCCTCWLQYTQVHFNYTWKRNTNPNLAKRLVRGLMLWPTMLRSFEDGVLIVQTFYTNTVTKNQTKKNSAKINIAEKKKEKKKKRAVTVLLNHSGTWKNECYSTFDQGLKLSGSLSDLRHRAVLKSDLIQYIVHTCCQEKFPGFQIFLALFCVLLSLLFLSCLWRKNQQEQLQILCSWTQSLWD